MKDGYIDFDEYIRQGEPDKREKATLWRTAIGLQAVDGLKTSEYLKETALKPVYLERFFRNLLLGEQWDLRNRYLHITPSPQWRVQPNMADPTSTPQVSNEYPTSTPQISDKLHTDNPQILKLVSSVGNKELSVSEMLSALQLKDRKNFLELYLSPAMKEGFVRMLYPESPRHPRQKYLLTAKGQALFNELREND